METLLFPPHGNVLSSYSQYLLPALREWVRVKSGHGFSGSSCKEEEEEKVPAPGVPRLLPTCSEGTGGDNLGMGAGKGRDPPEQLGLSMVCLAETWKQNICFAQALNRADKVNSPWILVPLSHLQEEKALEGNSLLRSQQMWALCVMFKCLQHKEQWNAGSGNSSPSATGAMGTWNQGMDSHWRAAPAEPKLIPSFPINFCLTFAKIFITWAHLTFSDT